MAIEAGTFETLIPSRYISFSLPISSIQSNFFFFTKHLQISVLDSPTQHTCAPPKIAAMLVPNHLQNDWIFTTQAGHLQLLLSSPQISRLILIGNSPNFDDYNNCTKLVEHEHDPRLKEGLEKSLYPLLIALAPKEIVKLHNFEIPFLIYEDNVINSVILEKCTGSCVGEMLIEDVEIEAGLQREFRRRLRFKRMPNLIQTEIRIIPTGFDVNGSDFIRIGRDEFCPDLGVLVHPYLAPMLAGLSLVSGFLQERFDSGVKPRGCCIGVGGGALLSFLASHLGFQVVGVEADEVVLRVANQYFGLINNNNNNIQLHVGDGIEVLRKMALHEKRCKANSLIAGSNGNDGCNDNFDVFGSKFDVIMVDLDSSDSRNGISAPTLEFMQKNVLLAAESSLSENGILVLNVIPPNRSFYDALIHELQDVFEELHEIDCGNEENFALIASKSSICCNSCMPRNAFLKKLKSVISGAYMNSIKKL